MSGWLSFSITVFMGFFAIMNPIANAPIFLSLTENCTQEVRRRIALKSTLVAFAIVCFFAIGGQLLFHIFGIGLPAFRTTGGILVFLVGKHLLEGNRTSPVHTPRAAVDHAAAGESPEADEALGMAISPLAIPILAGPGTIACAINFASGRTAVHIAVCLGAFGVLCAVTYFVFITGERLLKLLSPSALGVVSRLMGLILAVIGVQMLFEGLGGAFPQLFGAH